MNISLTRCFYLILLYLPLACFGQTDYLNQPGPIRFDNLNYNLSWSSHPEPNFYKQEYLVQGENADRFKTMLLLDVITNNPNLKDIVNAKIGVIKSFQEKNPVVQYEVFRNKDEYMIDFMLSENSPDGKSIYILERNVYRYKPFTDKAGKKGILLFGVSTRSYGKDIDQFLAALKSTRSQIVNTMAQFAMPVISIRK